MSEENIYGLSDETIEKIEKEIAHAEIDAETSEKFLDLVFPNSSPEEKAKISLFAEKFAELFLEDEE